MSFAVKFRKRLINFYQKFKKWALRDAPAQTERNESNEEEIRDSIIEDNEIETPNTEPPRKSRTVSIRESLNTQRPIENRDQESMQRPSFRRSTLVSTNRRSTTFLSDEDDNKDAIHIDDILRNIGFGWVQWWVFITAGFLLMSFVCETMGMSILSIAVKCDLDMSFRDVAHLRTAAFYGVITSSCLWGYLSDRFGRRKLLLISIHCSIVFSLISMFSNNYNTFFAMRYFVGFFIAGPSFIGMVYMSEFVPPEKRARVVNYMYLFNGFGMLYSPVIAHFLTPQTWKYKLANNYFFRPWRLLGMIYTIPGILGCVLLWTLPESAYFYLSAGKMESALKVLNWMANTNKQTEEPVQFFTEVGGVRAHADDKTKWWHFFGFYQVFKGTSKVLILCTLVVIIGMFSM